MGDRLGIPSVVSFFTFFFQILQMQLSHVAVLDEREKKASVELTESRGFPTHLSMSRVTESQCFRLIANLALDHGSRCNHLPFLFFNCSRFHVVQEHPLDDSFSCRERTLFARFPRIFSHCNFSMSRLQNERHHMQAITLLIRAVLYSILVM